MSQLEDLNRAMAYIEEHLDGTVDMDVLARIAVCSKYQLQRMFPYLTGVTLPEYIRRRAMTRAAQDLRGDGREGGGRGPALRLRLADGVRSGVPARARCLAQRCSAPAD